MEVPMEMTAKLREADNPSASNKFNEGAQAVRDISDSCAPDFENYFVPERAPRALPGTLHEKKPAELSGEKYLIYQDIQRILCEKKFQGCAQEESLESSYIYWTSVRLFLNRALFRILENFPVLNEKADRFTNEHPERETISILDILFNLKRNCSRKNWQEFTLAFELGFHFEEYENCVFFLLRYLKENSRFLGIIKFIYDSLKKDRLTQVYHNRLCDITGEFSEAMSEKYFFLNNENKYFIEILQYPGFWKFDKAMFAKYFHEIMGDIYRSNPKDSPQIPYPFFSQDIVSIFSDVHYILLVKDCQNKAKSLAFARYCGHLPKGGKDISILYMGCIFSPEIQGVSTGALIYKFLLSLPKYGKEDIILTAVTQNHSIMEMFDLLVSFSDKDFLKSCEIYNQSKSAMKNYLQKMATISGMRKDISREKPLDNYGFIPGLYSGQCRFEPYFKSHISSGLLNYQEIDKGMLGFLSDAEINTFFEKGVNGHSDKYFLKKEFKKMDALDGLAENNLLNGKLNKFTELLRRMEIRPSMDKGTFLVNVIRARDIQTLEKSYHKIEVFKQKIEFLKSDESLDEPAREKTIQNLKLRIKKIRNRKGDKYKNFNFLYRVFESTRKNIHPLRNSQPK
jgi:hypothetical protein